MISYSKRKVFSDRELDLWRRARVLVSAVDLGLPELEGKELRCHELARVVGRILDLAVIDGHYGCIEHSWLVIEPAQLGVLPFVLDVYAPGQAPQVQLLDMNIVLGHRDLYRPGDRRTDILWDVVDALERDLRRRVVRIAVLEADLYDEPQQKP